MSLHNVKVILKVDLKNERAKKEAMKLVFGIQGVDSVSTDKMLEKFTVIGNIDKDIVEKQLRKLCNTFILHEEPVKEPEKEELEEYDVAKKVILKVEFQKEKRKQKALNSISILPGIDSISMDQKNQKLTVTGNIDPVDVFKKLKKTCTANIVSFGPLKEPETKEEKTKKMKKKEEPKKVETEKEEPSKKQEPEKEEPKEDDVAKKVILKVEFQKEKSKQKALNSISNLPGVYSISMDRKNQKLTVTGNIDPVDVFKKLKKICTANIVSFGPLKEPETKKEKPKKTKKEEEPKKVEPEKEERSKEEPNKEEPGKEPEEEEPKKEEAEKEEPNKEEPEKEPEKEEPKKLEPEKEPEKEEPKKEEPEKEPEKEEPKIKRKKSQRRKSPAKNLRKEEPKKDDVARLEKEEPHVGKLLNPYQAYNPYMNEDNVGSSEKDLNACVIC